MPCHANYRTNLSNWLSFLVPTKANYLFKVDFQLIIEAPSGHPISNKNNMKIGFCIAAFAIGCLFAVLVRSNNQAVSDDPDTATTQTRLSSRLDTTEQDAASPELRLNIAKLAYGVSNGLPVSRYVCSNKNGLSFEVIDWGATIVAINIKDRSGTINNVVLNCEELEGYQACNAYFGSTIGRYSNRIANGQFVLDGQQHSLSLNDDDHHMHGGSQGFDKQIWSTEEIVDADSVGVRMLLTSPDGDQGYPGTCLVSVTYLLNNDDQFSIELEADCDAPTPVNLTQQIYWNLDGNTSESVATHQLQIDADQRLVLNDQQIPTGKLESVTDTRFDFQKLVEVGLFDNSTSSPISIDKPQTIHDTFQGYNDNFVLNSQTGELASAATLVSQKSGRRMDLWTTQPGLHLDTANSLDGLPASGGLQKHTGILLQTQHHPDSPNQPKFPSTILRPGEKYKQTTVFSFSIAK